jgi:pimeloyl-ACP methyl ester carboxylesterase
MCDRDMRLATLIVSFSAASVVAAEPVGAGRSRAEAVRLETPSGAIHGTLERPDRAGPIPVVVLIAGSGPTDRDGNQPEALLFTDSLRLLSRALAARGIATVRYDRRGVGESAAAAADEREVRIDHFAEDAAAWVRSLRADLRFRSVVVAGHSEGALVGMLAAKRAGADGFVSLAGPGRPLADVLRDQAHAGLSDDLKPHGLRILDELAAGRPVEEVPEALAPVFRPSAQPFLIAAMRYDPAEELATLDAPVLIVHGTTDAHIPAADARRLAGAHPDAELRIVRGMNHVLKPAVTPSEHTATYRAPHLALSPGVIDATAKFVRKVEGGRKSKGGRTVGGRSKT